MKSRCPIKHSSTDDHADARANARRYAASELENLKHDLEALAPAIAWVADFVTQSHQDLGRSGLVCPYVPEALRRDMLDFFVSTVELGPETGQEPADAAYIAFLEPLILQLGNLFVTTQSAETRFRLLHSYLIAFRGLPPEADRAALLIEALQKKLKPKFVALGLMIGEFHPISDAIGLRNPKFRPLRSPVPLLSIRNMVEVDFAFLSRAHDPATLRMEFLRSYLHYVGPELGPLSRSRAEEALLHAEEEALELQQTADQGPIAALPLRAELI